MSEITIMRRRNGPGWLVLSALTEMRVNTYAAALRFVHDLDRARRFAMDHEHITVTMTVADARRVLELAQTGLDMTQALIADATDEPTTLAATHRAALERVRTATETATLAL